MRDFCQQIARDREMTGETGDKGDTGDEGTLVQEVRKVIGPRNITELTKEWCEKDIGRYSKMSEKVKPSSKETIAERMITCFTNEHIKKVIGNILNI